ncbi:MAG TPA: carboxypeptidase-like regulatory domain-containing protein [Candidatus Acidoferrales bacterium]|jgi:hypothetical protein|nr:carboxypeptidase-like regulatory domain-containing protein [Candidatus Acidoferrales bacterium]
MKAVGLLLMAILASSVLALSVPASFAQTTYAQGKPKKGDASTRSVQGAVTNPDDSPAVGAVVQLENTKTLQVRSFITKEDGIFHFYELGTDVDYKLKAEDKKTGASSDAKTLSSFDSRKQAILNLKLSPKK